MTYVKKFVPGEGIIKGNTMQISFLNTGKHFGKRIMVSYPILCMVFPCICIFLFFFGFFPNHITFLMVGRTYFAF